MTATHPAWSLRDRRLVVTGASRGIGAAIAKEAVALGARVLAVARREGPLREGVDRWRRAGATVEYLATDASLPEGQDAIVAASKALWGGFDTLVLNVGTNLRRAAIEYTDAEFAELFQSNVASAFGLARRAHPALLSANDPSIVVVGSVAGQVSVGTGVPYGVTKAALEMLTRGLASEWGSDGIRVNLIAPWFIDTPLVKPLLDRPGFVEKVNARTPMGRIGQAEEAARAALFFAMPAASYVSGQSLAVDGGFLARGW